MNLRLSLSILLASCISVFSFAQSNVNAGKSNLSSDIVTKLKEKQFDMATANQPKTLDFSINNLEENSLYKNSTRNAEDSDISPFKRLEVQNWGAITNIEDNTYVYFSTEINATNFNIKTYDDEFNVEEDFSITVPSSANQVQLMDHYSTNYFNNDNTKEFMVYVHYFDPNISGPKGQIWEVWIVDSDGNVLNELTGNAAFAKYDNNNNKVLYTYGADLDYNATITAYDGGTLQVIDTYPIDADLINFYMGAPFDFATIDGQEYLVVSHYEFLFMDNMTLEIFPDNHLIVKLLNYDFDEVKSMSFDIQSRFGEDEFVSPMAEFGTFSSNADKNFNISKDIFNPDNKLEVVYGIYYYDMIQDVEWSTFIVANEDGDVIHELNEYIVGIDYDIANIDGEDTQIAFLYGENEPEATTLGFFDIESWNMVSTFDAVHQGDQLSDKFNRIPFESTYHYLIGIGSPDEINGDYFGVINEYKIDGTLVKRNQLYLPSGVQLFEPIMATTVLKDNLFTTENDDRYFLYTYKESAADGRVLTNLTIASDAENILAEFRGDGPDGNIVGAGITVDPSGVNVENMYTLYESTNDKLFVDLYKLPFDTTLGVDDFENTSFSIYPNPSNGIINVETSVLAKDIQIYSITGKLLHSQKLNEMSSTVNISSLARGIYIAHINLENGSTKKAKLIKQ